MTKIHHKIQGRILFMIIKSLGFQTDLYFHRFTGVIIEHNDYIVVKTPSNPTFFWGNLLYFKEPPTKLSFLKWQSIFEEEFRSLNVQHMTLAWDSIEGEEGETSLFIADGFSLEKSSVMIAEKITRPSKINEQINVRPIIVDADWEKVIENQIQCRADHFNGDLYRHYILKKIADYRMMINNHRGLWMGAFLGDTLVGDLGLFFENQVGRFQVVETHPDFRRQGVCSTLLYKTSLHAEKEMNLKTLVIVADPDYHAQKIYESVGFKIKEIQIGMCKYNKELWATS